MSGIAGIKAPPTAQLQEIESRNASGAAKGASKDSKATSKEDVAKVGRDFEAILVRQMLEQTKVAGKAGGYADMAVEALSTSISSAGGLGMGKAIEMALARGHEAQQVPLNTSLSPDAKSQPKK